MCREWRIHRAVHLLAGLCAVWFAVGCGGSGGGGDNNNNLNNSGGDGAVNCGDGVQQGIEQCDDGADNSDTEPDACRTDCSLARCGDGVVDTGEACDDGPQNSDEVPDACRSDCEVPACGDSVVDVASGESCDDGNTQSGDNCSEFCLVEHCGNGVVDPGEECDDGNLDDGDGCSAACNSDETCGNGIVDIYAIPPEECDDGNLDEGDGCSDSCHIEVCGNGALDPGEVCDDNNLLAGDGCSPDCRSDESCGNNYIDFLVGEQCDDGNHRSHDGCSSGCTGEVPVWTQHREDLLAMANHAMTYDSSRMRLVLFGGSGACGPVCNLTYEYDNVRWHRVYPQGVQPPPRRQGMLAYDSIRNVAVLIGGQQSLYHTDTWEYDGGSWVLVPTATSPPGRKSGAMAFDASRGRVVLFGGEDGNGERGDVWEYDGNNWMPGSTAGSLPGPRSRAVMVYDSQRQIIVLVGGDGSGPGMDSVWSYDGGGWSLETPIPGGRSSHSMVYDANRNAVVVFGGYSNAFSCPGLLCNDIWEATHSGSEYVWTHVPTVGASPVERRRVPAAFDPVLGGMVVMGGADNSEGAYDDTWLWDGVSWEDLSARIRPEPRMRHAMVYDPVDDRLVMFGGDDNAADEVRPPTTWFFEAEGWRGVPCSGPPDCPASRLGHVMAWDANRSVVVLFGGGSQQGNTFLAQNDTWELSGESWIQASPPATLPAPRAMTAMAFHPGTGKTILFGGTDESDLSGTMYGDTWEYDGTHWTQLFPANSPAPRAVHVMTWDASNQEIVMMGGVAGGLGGITDIWTFDGTDWQDKTPPTSAPLARGWPVLVYDPLRARTVLFGGLTVSAYFDDTWEWDGAMWKQLFANSPTARGFAAAAYHEGLRMVAVHGGFNATALGELYFFQYGSPWPEEVCDSGADDDNDGDIDCADPDCDGQACVGGTCVGGVCQ